MLERVEVDTTEDEAHLDLPHTHYFSQAVMESTNCLVVLQFDEMDGATSCHYQPVLEPIQQRN